MAIAATLASAAAAAATNHHYPPQKLLAVGNPLLDLVVQVDAAFLEEFHLKCGDGVLQTAAQEGIYERIIKDLKPTFLPGGSSLNSARVFHAVSRGAGRTSFFGAVGDDDAGRRLEKLASQEGVDMHLQKVRRLPTGRCAVLVTNKERTLCTSLGASLELEVTPEVDALTDAADICYITTYVLHASADVVFRVAERSVKASKVLGLNLSSSFHVLNNKDKLKALLPSVNILFGNDEEYTDLAASLGLIKRRDHASAKEKEAADCHVCEVVLGLMTLQVNGAAAATSEVAAATAGNGAAASAPVIKILVMTRKKEPVYVVQARPDGAMVFHKVSVPPVPEDEIIDLNGAGDAFVGGFLAAFAQGYSLRKAALLGSLAAGQIIRCEGFSADLSRLRDLMSDERLH